MTDLIEWADILRRNSEQHRAEERERKAALAEELERAADLPFRDRVLQAYRAYRCRLMNGREFFDFVDEAACQELGLPREDDDA